jgi:sugar/nucleoside kinase (ribokinase family)
MRLSAETRQFISLLNASPLSQRLVDNLRKNRVGIDHMLTDATIAESRNLIFLVDGEHVVMTVCSRHLQQSRLSRHLRPRRHHPGNWIHDHGIGRVVRTLAADGAETLDGEAHQQVAGYSVAVADVTGAGDTFGGALTWCIARNHAFTDALEFAVAAASRSVTIHGSRGGKASLGFSRTTIACD